MTGSGGTGRRARLRFARNGPPGGSPPARHAPAALRARGPRRRGCPRRAQLRGAGGFHRQRGRGHHPALRLPQRAGHGPGPAMDGPRRRRFRPSPARHGRPPSRGIRPCGPGLRGRRRRRPRAMAPAPDRQPLRRSAPPSRPGQDGGGSRIQSGPRLPPGEPAACRERARRTAAGLRGSPVGGAVLRRQEAARPERERTALPDSDEAGAGGRDTRPCLRDAAVPAPGQGAGRAGRDSAGGSAAENRSGAMISCRGTAPPQRDGRCQIDGAPRSALWQRHDEYRDPLCNVLLPAALAAEHSSCSPLPRASG